VSDGLKDASDIESVKAVFVGAMLEPEPVKATAEPDMLTELVTQLKRQNEIILWKDYP